MRKQAKRFVGAIGVAAATIAMVGNSQAVTAVQNQTTIQHEVKAVQRENKVQSKKVIRNVAGSGLDLVTDYPKGSGLSPKEYGMRYGNGKSRKYKSNRIRLSHNAKLKRRQ